jgi:hypothetical protein
MGRVSGKITRHPLTKFFYKFDGDLAMKAIQKNDVVGLTRSLDNELPEGLVGMVTQCHGDCFDVKFPIQGRETLHARVAPEDVKFLLGDLQSGK